MPKTRVWRDQVVSNAVNAISPKGDVNEMPGGLNRSPGRDV